ncbi:MAG: peptide chain release factor 3 [Deltaproteobacteria bacterium]|nr:peptide chain release factor 3 [Deltaproteobacteria bacterium]
MDHPQQRTIAREVARRRTFAIISHPDAGKTTLTEKLLLYGGAVREAGAVRAQKAARHATSDWLELEKQRGISVSSSVLHFEHHGFRVNLLDTPGHRDFSEDTYRTLVAADSAVMLIDAAKGVEAQTRKLFEVCRLRRIPIFTFVNKMDRDGREPLALIGEIEEVLGIDAVPLCWPIGAGRDFRGVYDRQARAALLFSGGHHGTLQVDERRVAGEPETPALREALGPFAGTVADALALLDGAGAAFDRAAVAAGRQTPVFFGSALTNYGVLPFLDRFLELAPPPGPRTSTRGRIDPVAHPFSGFVFKIQANMDPDHRDRVAFVRICSGRFERGATTVHARTGKPVRLTRSTLVMAQEREQVDEAFPGDVVGLFDPGSFRIGDTLCDEGDFSYDGIPSFSPEHFARVEVAEVMKRKALAKGLEQLAQEGVVQLFAEPGSGSSAPILGAVGPLQFEVLQHRLATEYRVALQLTPLPWTLARWPRAGFDPEAFRFSDSVRVVEDRDGSPVLLFRSPWNLQVTRDKYPALVLAETGDGTRRPGAEG